jgi:hypothetical protein
MVGRVANTVKPKTKPKPRLGAKASAQVKSTKVKVSPSTDTAEAPKPRRRTKAETRTRIYWAVFNQNCKRVAVFEFDQKDEAEKRAGKLIKSSGDHHFIQKIKAAVPA